MSNLKKIILAGSIYANHLHQRMIEYWVGKLNRGEHEVLSNARKGASKMSATAASHCGLKIDQSHVASWMGAGRGYNTSSKNQIMSQICDGAMIFNDGRCWETKHLIGCLALEGKSRFTKIIEFDSEIEPVEVTCQCGFYGFEMGYPEICPRCKMDCFSIVKDGRLIK